MFGIPLSFYTEFFYNIILLFVIVTLVHTYVNQGGELVCYRFNSIAALAILFFVILYMGLRPVSGKYFGDMRTYERYFLHFENGGAFLHSSDLGFWLFMKAVSKVVSLNVFFLVCAMLYLIPPFLALKRWHPNHYFLALLIYIASMSFWTYGTNGIRAGLGTSLFIWGLSYRSHPIKMLGILILSVLFHKSMLLPLVALGLTFLYNKPKYYLWFWFLSIVLSVTMGGVWVNLFSSLGFGDDRLAGYLTSTEYADQFSSTGFRWDFLLYSFMAVFAGYLYIFRYNFKDKFYHQIFNTYLISNAFWIMVIRASFSNRFAYLSWFMMAIVIIYPLLKYKMFRYQYSITGLVILGYFSFTYVLYYISK
ncbi:EpsG family protein [Labilibaculum antarcticum]|uniref:EpsG family protein n=1 Tax=Labilibaculum antarcticum TaxID=1717717 RepID=A0A1Y1CRL2_9BACT|nr:EpsG family protein [Labilibaculum antarcticum]BAX82633.1 hypothetical protein ALGA_4343 [Labilibaculum antarcticum]